MGIDNRWHRRGGKPTAVEVILRTALMRNGLDKDLARYQFVLNWKNIVGARLEKVTRPRSLRNGVLTIEVPTSAWAQELSFFKEEIREKLSDFLERDTIVRNIIFKVAQWEDRSLPQAALKKAAN